VYLDPNLSDELDIFDDDIESGDANWVRVNWTVYDSNLGDGNTDGNAGGLYSLTPGSGAGTLTTVDMDTNEANSMTIQLSVKHTLGVEDGDILLYYWNGTTYDLIADLNSVGPNDVWTTYTDDVNEDEYFIPDFKLKLVSDISAGEVFIDNVSVTNTWPIVADWLVYSGDGNDLDLPSDLDLDTTYYWRVDTVNDACSASPWKGYLWEFTTEAGKARDPDPADGTGRIPDGNAILLEWTSSCLADSGDYIYISTDFDDVNESNLSVRSGPLSDPCHVTDVLEYNKKYYWKVTAVGGGLPEGDVWAFQTAGYPLMYFKFDGVLDANVGNIPDGNFLTDSLDNVTFMVDGDDDANLKYGESNPLYNATGTSAHFTPYWEDNDDDGSGVFLRRQGFGSDLLDLDGPAYTIEAWVRQDGDAANVRDGDLEGTILRKEYGSYGLGIDDDGTVKFMHSGVHFSGLGDGGRIASGEWHHIAAVYDETDDSNQNQRIYINGLLVGDNNEVSRNPVDDSEDWVGIGAFREQDVAAARHGNYFNGAIDELRVSDLALDVDDFLIRGDVNLAWLPRPSNYATGVAQDAVLQWNPGEHGVFHQVYFGTSWDDVNAATTAVPLGVYVDRDPCDPCDWDPCGLVLETTYYWRVDEVNDACGASPWKGNVWRFTVTNQVIIDSFEQYSSPGNEVYDTWDDNTENDSGSFVDLGFEAYESEQSMYYNYNNIINWGYGAYVSEASRPVDFNDWNSLGLKSLSLHFYGDPANKIEELYVGVESSAGGDYSEVRYGDEGNDNNDVNEAEWHEWLIPLSDFTDGGTDLNDVETIYVGFGDRTNTTTPGEAPGGVVYIDEIRLMLPICIPEEGPLYDLDGDCIVAWGDVEIIADDWLIADINCPNDVAPTGLIGHWALDGDANDSSTNANHGVAQEQFAWVAGKIGPNSIEFSDACDPNGGRVLVPDHPSLTPAAELTVAAWVNPSEDQDDETTRAVVKGGDNTETYSLELEDNTYPNFMMRDPCGDSNTAESGIDLKHNEWAHIAGTFDGSALKIYVNGRLEDTEDVNTFVPQADANGLAIGNRSDDMEKPFIGKIDDVRLYDVALSHCDVVYLASEGSGYIPVPDLAADLYKLEPKGERAVNIRDAAMLLETWLVEKLWPE
jgi:hypothetical protein